MRCILLAASVLASTAFGFKNTSPFLVWSSTSDESLSDAQSEVTSGVIAAEEIYGTIGSIGCDWNTLVVGHAHGLHQSRVSGLRLPSTDADLSIPYLVRPSKEGLDEAIDEWAQICGAQVVADTRSLKDGKNVIKMDVSAEQDLTTVLDSVPSPYILIVTGSHPDAKQERQEGATPSSEPSEPLRPSSSAPADDDTTVDGPLLERVQLLTTPIITGLLVTFLLFLPILYVGISALAGIQVPPRMLEIGKATHVGKDRKDQ
ncbi:hypothetical protein DB88DRAFT_512431 [Papiliotrema laurentii]|uniref:Protein BIG1 n=1 Tax=Papiliotrema laurentii TaxID=5418 RepID=A0AAD9CTS6_PAPLA|nr:hypothetical protein DB88DRAFT_512431 [Papiliotrema laurentii]